MVDISHLAFDLDQNLISGQIRAWYQGRLSVNTLLFTLSPLEVAQTNEVDKESGNEISPPKFTIVYCKL